jgi:hypothetical protein
MTLFDVSPPPLDPSRLDGRYTLYDDGWCCRLDLAWTGTSLSASFYSYDRTRGFFPASADLDMQRGTCTLVVEDFNELPRQQYDGLVFTAPVVGLAGRTDWNGQLFGFLAARRPPLPIGPECPTLPGEADLFGSYVLHGAAGNCVIHIPSNQGATCRGSICSSDGLAHDIVVATSAEDPRRFTLSVEGSTTTITVWMFSRHHDSLAGWIESDGRRTGCYLVRIGIDDH